MATFSLPSEGTIFRAIGDTQGDAVYKIVNGKVTTIASPSYIANTAFKDPSTGISYNAGDVATNPHDVQWLDPSYRGTATSRQSAAQIYGQDKYNALSAYNLADIKTAQDQGHSFDGTPFSVNTNLPANAVNPNSIGINGQQGALNGTAPSNNPVGPTYAAQSANQGVTPFTTDPSGIVPGGKPIGPYTAPSTVGSANMGSTGSTNYSQGTGAGTGSGAAVLGGMAKSAADQAVKDAENAKLGPQDQSISDLIKSSLDLNTQESGKAGYQNQQNSLAGVDEKTKAVNDLQAELQGVLNEHAAAQLTPQGGSGVTTAIDSRQRDFETNQSAIKALRLNSLIAAANSNLTYAQSQANKAVALKFDPIEAQIAANKANIELIKNDPKTTAEEKARADNISIALDAQKAVVAQQKTDMASILSIANDAISKGATALQAQAIQNSGSPAAALNLYAGYALNKQNPTALQTETAAISSANSQLSAAKGTDGYTDPNLYARLRSSSPLSATDFDNRFGYLVNPASTARLGIGTTSTNNGASDADINKQLAQIPSGTSSEDIAAYIRSLGGTPSKFGY